MSEFQHSLSVSVSVLAKDLSIPAKLNDAVLITKRDKPLYYCVPVEQYDKMVELLTPRDDSGKPLELSEEEIEFITTSSAIELYIWVKDRWELDEVEHLRHLSGITVAKELYSRIVNEALAARDVLQPYYTSMVSIMKQTLLWEVRYLDLSLDIERNRAGK